MPVVRIAEILTHRTLVARLPDGDSDGAVECTGSFPYIYTGDLPYNLPDANRQDPNMRIIIPQTGGSPDPDDVIGRDDAIARIVAGARQGNNHLLSDPRRMGKTSLLIRLCDQPDDDVTAVKIDLEGCVTAEAVVVRILRGIGGLSTLKDRTTRMIKAALGDGAIDVGAGPLTLHGVAKAAGPLATLESCISAINADLDSKASKGKASKGKAIVIVALDEVTIAAEAIARRDADECHQLLQTLRHLRGDANPRVRWILSGSIGFHHVLRKANATEGLINDLAFVELGPLGHNHAVDLTQALLDGIRRRADLGVINRLIDRTNAIPFMLHNALHRLDGAASPVANGPITIDEAEAAFTTYLSDRGQSGAWTHLVTRVDSYYDNPTLATAILDEQAISNEALSFDAVGAAHPDVDVNELRTLIDHLVDDHYLDQNTLVWRYPILRKTWMLRRRITPTTNTTTGTTQ